MRFEKKKITKMIDELSSYCLNKGATDIMIHLKKEPDRYLIDVRAEGVTVSERDFENMRKKIKSHREVEMEEYAWSLAGESLTTDELALVASMTDHADATLENQVLTINLVRLIH